MLSSSPSKPSIATWFVLERNWSKDEYVTQFGQRGLKGNLLENPGGNVSFLIRAACRELFLSTSTFSFESCDVANVMPGTDQEN